MDEIILTIDHIKHGAWIIVTLIWLIFNMVTYKKEYGHGAGFANVVRLAVSSFLYLIFWIIWLIIF